MHASMTDLDTAGTAEAERIAAVMERDAALAYIDFLKNTRSWRITAPLRFLMRLIRWGGTPEDRSRFRLLTRQLWDAGKRKQGTREGRCSDRRADTGAHRGNRDNRDNRNNWDIGSGTLPFPPMPPTPAMSAISTQGGSEPASISSSKFDVICLANIDWSARFQRPQQMMSQFARHGYRVFYIVASRVALEGQAYSLNQVSPGIFEVALAGQAARDFYKEAMSDGNTDACLLSLAALSADFRIKTAISVVHLSYWTPLAVRLRKERDWRIQYDCMDDWVDFPNIGTALLRQEEALVAEADLVTVTGSILEKKWSGASAHCALIRNGVDFSFFARHCIPNNLLAGIKGTIIGFYGALAEWIDYQLLAAIATRRPDWNLVLVGDVFVTDLAGLESMPNVHLIGRRPYPEMPLYLYHFDACLIPFRLYNVTHAVDPVKFYEFVSAGKPVVSTPLEEMKVYEEFVYFANGPEEFIEKIELALDEREPDLATKRIELARANDWKNRFGDTLHAITALYPKVTIIVVTYNNIELTQLCIDSIFRNTTWPNYEIIVVDNASADGTRNYLRYLAHTKPGVKTILNGTNRGFAAANNQGLSVAQGEFLVLLNNDTVVPKGWIDPLLRHLEMPDIGLVGPVTNSAGNEAKIQVTYSGLDQMDGFADRYTAQHHGRLFDIPMLAMFCIAMRRDTFGKIGFLDEKFGIGMFEDDDYSRRAQSLGFRTVCAEDAFVHHYGQAAFKKLIPGGAYQRLWDRNQAYFESKWGAWQPHVQRQAAGVAETYSEVPSC
jgi:GT2 family glycosyltransferase/glycosyltransferase involved in cell wall biosynthesis